MEIPIKLTFKALESSQLQGLHDIFLYLREVGIILFAEQLEELNLKFPPNFLIALQDFTRRYPDFFPCMEKIELSSSGIEAIVVTGWSAEPSINALVKMMSFIDISLDSEILLTED